MTVILKEVTKETVRKVCNLTVADHQTDYVATTAESMAEATFYPEAWYRAIYNNEELVGLILMYDETLSTPKPDKPKLDVWRILIDQRFQGRGFGKKTLEQVIKHARDKNSYEGIGLSFVPGNDRAERLYRSLGFKPTGAIEDGEVVMNLSFKEETS